MANKAPPTPPPGGAHGGQPHYPPPGSVGGFPQAVATDSPETQRNVGMLAHLIPLIAAVVTSGMLGFVASIVVYVIYKDRGEFVRVTTANALNIQLTMLVAIAISIPLMFVLVGILTALAAIITAIALHIIGAMKASKGELWMPPLTYPFVK